MKKIRYEVEKIKDIMGILVEAKKKTSEFSNRTTEYNSKKFPISAKKMKELINSQYTPCSGKRRPCVGKISTDDCQTDLGVLGGNYSELKLGLSNSEWSVVNRFDTNSLVKKKIWDFYQENTDDMSFVNWILSNAKNLFNGKYTSELVELNKSTIASGYMNESFAIKIIKSIWGSQIDSITQHCAGDLRDRKKGQDFDVVIEGESHYFQIKPLSSEIPINDIIKKYSGIRGPFYEIGSWYHSEKYNEEDVDVIMYVNDKQGKYIMFNNISSNISTIKVHKDYGKPQFVIRYYEEPISDNLNLETIQVSEKSKKKSLEIPSQKKMEYYQQRKSYFQDLIDKIENPD